MKTLHTIPALALALLGSTRTAVAADAPTKRVKVVTTLAVLANLASEVGGDFVEAQALSNPSEDPHFVQPRPTLMTRAREADLFVELGLQLELWAGKVVEGSGNTKIQAGQPGRVIASAGISTLELPQQLSREWGDVHPYGNPHIWLDPLNVKDMAANIEAGLAKLDPAHAAAYEERLKKFQDKIDVALFGAELVKEVGGRMLTRKARGGKLDEYLEAGQLTDKLGGWLAKARPLKGRPVVTYHKSWIYFTERFGLQVPIEIEEKPGIPPSARHRDAVVELIKQRGVKTILEEVFYDRAAADYLAKETGAKVVVVPIDVGEAVGAKGYCELIDMFLDKLLESESAKSGAR